MVSFSCEVCNDTIQKKKLDQHKQRCYGAYYTCIDCSTTFQNNDYKAHTSCMTEAEKYEKNFRAKARRAPVIDKKPKEKEPKKPKENEPKEPKEKEPKEPKEKEPKEPKEKKPKEPKEKKPKENLLLNHFDANLYKAIKKISKSSKKDKKQIMKELKLSKNEKNEIIISL
ncbi:hypothetical protein HYPBUDRAFT_12083 [Hyphopichia burtonii NRRL Y-1933]|uniref:Zinc finger C2H2 LYAR-type domain-containing protein n=1 Tax=Hyphopichia burtonii NRRL Y-1933 TaxID=984485 RepID=A0A1E4RGN6_9ASCO|nr:hypothetical protein HYPBUDRAFT_12083 [Hyphopichia burtonii NRRL Y-1933]ODV66376.1 hypothetical protein HYPBUDRAFT_12083 [Hyphopichia burtonii NRRL Y-1933]